jgi:hypothetical protein
MIISRSYNFFVQPSYDRLLWHEYFFGQQSLLFDLGDSHLRVIFTNSLSFSDEFIQCSFDNLGDFE